MKGTFINAVLHYPGRILLSFALVVLFLCSGLSNLSISNDFRIYFSKDNPQLIAFENFEENFTPSDNASLIVEPRQGDVFTRRGLMLLEQLTEESWQIPFSRRVSSVQNFQHVHAAGDDIISQNLYQNAAALSEVEIENIRATALSKEQLVKRLISEDGKIAVIITVINLDRNAANDSIEVAHYVRALRDRYQIEYPEFLISVGGSSSMNAALAEGIAGDMQTLLPMSYLIIFTGLCFFLRSFAGMFSILIMVSACLLATFGFFGLLAPVLTPISGFVPSVLLSIMVADSVHILTSFFYAYRAGMVKQKAIAESLKLNILPVTITSVTTCIGFLCLNFSDSPPYRALGNMIAAGVVLAWIFSLTVLPALIHYLPMGSKKVNERSGAVFAALASSVIHYKRPLLLVLSLLAVTFTFFIPANRLSDNWVHYFDDSFEIRRVVDRLEHKIAGVGRLEFILEAKELEGINEPEYLSQLEAFVQWIEQQEYVVHADSYVSVLKDMNKLMHGDDSAWHKLPDTRAQAAQYLLLYELSLPYGLGTDDMIDISKTSTRVAVGTSVIGTENLLILDRKAIQWLQLNAPAITASPATGMSMVFAHIVERNLISLLKGTAIALVLISILLIVVLRSWRYGLLSLIPNIIPAAIAYGIWGVIEGRIDLSLAVVACATLGIVVDDTVHFMYKYVYARRHLKQDASDAIQYSFKTVGFALFVTSIVLGLGFAVLGLSHMYTTLNVGLMMCLTIVVALIVDFLLLPPLLLLLDRDQ